MIRSQVRRVCDDVSIDFPVGVGGDPCAGGRRVGRRDGFSPRLSSLFSRLRDSALGIALLALSGGVLRARVNIV